MASASPISIQRVQGHQRRTSVPMNVNMNHPSQVQGQVPYRMSFSPSEREYHSQQQSAHHPDASYSGIVGGASRSIFGSDDENYLPSHPSPMDSRGYNGDHQQQQYLAHERLASIAERSTTNGPHHNGQYTPLIPNRPSVPSFPLQLQTSVGTFTGGGMNSSPIGVGPGAGDWATSMASKRA